jgi:hypothetical protein
MLHKEFPMTLRWIAAGVVALSSIFMPRVAPAQTAVSVSARIGDFHVAVANYYQVPEREVIVIRERRISDDDLPIVLFMAREARVPPARIIALRESGRSWWSISVRLGLRPDVYYVPLAVAPGPPYGKAYGHYKKPRHKWNTIVLSDADIVNLVHLRFLSEHYRIAPEYVIEARGRHRNVVAVYSDIGDRRARDRGRDRDRDDDDDDDRGKGKGRKHDRKR